MASEYDGAAKVNGEIRVLIETDDPLDIEELRKLVGYYPPEPTPHFIGGLPNRVCLDLSGLEFDYFQGDPLYGIRRQFYLLRFRQGMIENLGIVDAFAIGRRNGERPVLAGGKAGELELAAGIAGNRNR